MWQCCQGLLSSKLYECCRHSLCRRQGLLAHDIQMQHISMPKSFVSGPETREQRLGITQPRRVLSLPIELQPETASTLGLIRTGQGLENCMLQVHHMVARLWPSWSWLLWHQWDLMAESCASSSSAALMLC